MPQIREKLSPDQDLQCYFLTPSAIATMSQANSNGFTLSGKWRQQFDWAVVEWNKDNAFDHPAFRNLPDGDLSGLVLTYLEERNGCIPLESNLVPVVDWNNLRIWAPGPDGVTEQIYYVELASAASPVSGNYVSGSATMTLASLPAAGQRVGLAVLEQHFYFTVGMGDGLTEAAAGVAANVNQFSPTFSASSSGPSVTISWKLSAATSPYPDLRGSNGNRVTVYGFAEGGAAAWQSVSALFGGGEFPTLYQVTIDFGKLKATGIPTDQIRKLRWTWAADLQPGSFQQQEFQVVISNWSVTGTNRTYSVAGPGSRRIEDTDPEVSYAGNWTVGSGNYSGSRIHSTALPSAMCTITYSEATTHQLYLGTRRFAAAAPVSVSIDGAAPQTTNLAIPGEDVLVRTYLGSVPAGTHKVTVEHAGSADDTLYFDFLELVYPSPNLPVFAGQPQLALATDFDTYHSQSLPAERTAWIVNQLGFTGRLNHYTGALWFYELTRTGTQYASLTMTLSLTGSSNPVIQLNLAAAAQPGEPAPASTPISHLVLPDDTEANVAEALAGLINIGTNLLWASVSGNKLILTARAMGSQGNGITVAVDNSTQGVSVLPTMGVLSGGIDGSSYELDDTDPLNSTLIATADYWRTDLSAIPRINRAARDWHQAYFIALKGYGIDVVASFSTELMNVDPSASTGMAQRYPDGTPVVLNTPSIQTNFSATALQYWTQVYLDMAAMQNVAGLQPYLQAGEVQWWYFPKQTSDVSGASSVIGMPFYDGYTETQYQLQNGSALPVILNNTVNPTQYGNVPTFLAGLIGTYTQSIRTALKQVYPSCRFEVLYPTDTNNTALNEVINFAIDDWTPENLDCLKTESFTFTGDYNLAQSAYSISVSQAKGFGSGKRSHLVGIGDSWSPWMKEVNLAQGQMLESVVLFALDQFCLIGYPPPPYGMASSSQRQGK